MTLTEPYDPDDSLDFYEEYYASQVGHGLPYYAGMPLHSGQRGRGLGSIFKGLARMALPVLKRTAVSAGKALVRTGAEVASDLMDGKNLRSSARDRFRHSGRELVGELLNGGPPPSRRAPQKRRAPARSAGRGKIRRLRRTIFDRGV